MNDYTRRIRNLEKKYSETHTQSGEKILKTTKAVIDKNYGDNQKRRRADTVLAWFKNKDTVKDEVYDIVLKYNMRRLCSICSFEVVVAVIILYVWRCRSPMVQLDHTGLWKRYGLDWRRYGLVVSNLLKLTRESERLRVREVDLHRDDFIVR